MDLNNKFVKLSSLKLVKLQYKYKKQLFDMMNEWIKFNDNDHSPHAIFKNDYHNFDYYLKNLDPKIVEEGKVKQSTFFALDITRNIFVGACNIRHNLNESLLLNGGHIGDGIRPSERRKGFATALIHLSLQKCKELGINKVLIVCNKDNIGSKKSIIYNNGILENEVEVDNKIWQRYWIDLN